MMRPTGSPPGPADLASAPGRERIALAVVAAGMLGSLPFLVHPWYDATGDGTTYLLTAKSLAAGDGYSYLGLPFFLRAPGFPAMLAPFVSGDAPKFFAINFMESLFGVACVLLFHAYHRRTLGWVTALAAAVLIWTQPGFQRLSTEVMSDVPGAALLMACLLLERWSSRSSSPRREIWLGVAVGLSVYVRAALLLLVPAIFLGRLLRPRDPEHARPGLRRLILFVAVACAVVAPWSLRNRMLDRTSAPTDQVWQYSLSTLIWHEDYGDPASPRLPVRTVLARIPRHTGKILATLGAPEDVGLAGSEDRASTARPVLAAVLLSCLLFQLVRRRDPGAIFAVASLLTVAVFPSSILYRYMLPVFLVALPATVELLRDGLVRLVPSSVVRWGIPAALLLWSAIDFAPRNAWGVIESRHRARVEISDLIASLIEPDDRLAAVAGADLTLFLDRPVYSLTFAIRRSGLDAGTEAIIDKYDVNRIVLIRGGTRSARERVTTAALSRALAVRYPDAVSAVVADRSVKLVRVRPSRRPEMGSS